MARTLLEAIWRVDLASRYRGINWKVLVEWWGLVIDVLGKSEMNKEKALPGFRLIRLLRD